MQDAAQPPPQRRGLAQRGQVRDGGEPGLLHRVVDARGVEPVAAGHGVQAGVEPADDGAPGARAARPRRLDQLVEGDVGDGASGVAAAVGVPVVAAAAGAGGPGLGGAGVVGTGGRGELDGRHWRPFRRCSCWSEGTLWRSHPGPDPGNPRWAAHRGNPGVGPVSGRSPLGFARQAPAQPGCTRSATAVSTRSGCAWRLSAQTASSRNASQSARVHRPVACRRTWRTEQSKRSSRLRA